MQGGMIPGEAVKGGQIELEAEQAIEHRRDRFFHCRIEFSASYGDAQPRMLGCAHLRHGYFHRLACSRELFTLLLDVLELQIPVGMGWTGLSLAVGFQREFSLAQ